MLVNKTRCKGQREQIIRFTKLQICTNVETKVPTGADLQSAPQ